jgi:DNA-binding transcriptional MocR family regulator
VHGGDDFLDVDALQVDAGRAEVGVAELALNERGVLVEDGAWHWARPDDAPPSIVLGYGATPEPAIRRGIGIVAEALRAVVNDS